MAETFYFEIIASDKKFYSGACEHVIFPAVDGLYGVLANHEDTVTAVVAGELRFKVDGEWKVCIVGEGFADVTRDFVVIVVDTVERPEDIDIIRAREAKQEQKNDSNRNKAVCSTIIHRQHCHVLWHD